MERIFINRTLYDITTSLMAGVMSYEESLFNSFTLVSSPEQTQFHSAALK